MWTYESIVGFMKIYFDEKVRTYALVIDDELCKSYTDANKAADDVYNFSTGHSGWDKHKGSNLENLPTDLTGWKYVVSD